MNLALLMPIWIALGCGLALTGYAIRELRQLRLDTAMQQRKENEQP